MENLAVSIYIKWFCKKDIVLYSWMTEFDLLVKWTINIIINI